MSNGMRCVAPDVRAAQRAACAVLGGLSAERPAAWDSISTERRSRPSGSTRPPARSAGRGIAPAHREGVRRFLQRFDGPRVEAALEATTGWRFVTEELRAIGASVHLAEPAETSARRGNKKRAKTDRADARHLRELLMVGRLPESWIAPDHLLDLRARVRLRHALVNQRGESQQRIHSVLSTTATRSGAICSRVRTARGSSGPRCRPSRASRSPSRWR